MVADTPQGQLALAMHGQFVVLRMHNHAWIQTVLLRGVRWRAGVTADCFARVLGEASPCMMVWGERLQDTGTHTINDLCTGALKPSEIVTNAVNCIGLRSTVCHA